MKGERGFTLVEALVAFAILAVVIVALYESMGTGVSGLARAGRFDEAVLIAESRLAELEATKTLPAVENAVEGTEYRWRVEPIADETPEPPELAASTLKAQKIRLIVTWQDRGAKREIAVERLLLIPRQPGQ